ncbi:hypothetical protein BYT27DRAFT_7262989 [Phlegmacium glaucopus]|nr:hypothetical protein BYT27DRAFT_7262989 [Phlegmacium glaucopus]
MSTIQMRPPPPIAGRSTILRNTAPTVTEYKSSNSTKHLVTPPALTLPRTISKPAPLGPFPIKNRISSLTTASTFLLVRQSPSQAFAASPPCQSLRFSSVTREQVSSSNVFRALA